MNHTVAAIAGAFTAALLTVSAPFAGAATVESPQRFLPNRRVNSLAQDSLGYLWIATPNGLCRNLGNSFDVFQPERNNHRSLPSTNIVSVLYLHPDIWVATSRGVASRNIYNSDFIRCADVDNRADADFFNGFINTDDNLLAYGSGGLFLIDRESKTMRHLLSLPSGQIYVGAADTDGSLWLHSGYTLTHLGRDFKPIRSYPLGSVRRITSMVCHNGQLLLGTRQGLRAFNARTGELSVAGEGSVLANCEIHSMLLTGDDNLLVSTRRDGEQILNLQTGHCSYFTNQYNFAELQSNDVMVSFVDRDSNVWLGTLDKGLLLACNKRSLFDTDRSVTGAFRDKYITALECSLDGELWIGTRYDGLHVYCPSKRFARKIDMPFPDPLVDCIFADSQNRIWVGSNYGLFVSSEHNGGSWRNAAKLPSQMVSAAEDTIGNIWTGTSDNGIYIYNPDLTLRKHLPCEGMRNKNIPIILRLESGKMLVSSYTDGLYIIDPVTYETTPLDARFNDEWASAIDMIQDRNGRIWVGTYDNCLICYDPEKKEITPYTDFLSQDAVALCEDTDGNIWASSSNGLYCIDPVSGKRRSFLNSVTATAQQFHEKAVVSMPDGSIYFGGNVGLRQVTPANERGDGRRIPVYLTGVTPLYQNFAHPDSATDPAFVRSLSLAHSNNGLCIDFVGLCYGADVEYSYMLKGYDRNWIESGGYTRAIYSNLPSGDYEFMVRTRTTGEWSEPTGLLDIEVLCAPWLHPLAITLYIILLIAAIIVAARLHIRLKFEKERMEMAEKKIANERNIATSKINFFNNISHELRTPLTLIIAPVKLLLSNFTDMSAPDIRKNLEYVNTNVQRMLHLTTQILNFREMSGETPPLQVARGDIASQLESIVGLFNIYAAERGISIELTCHIKEKGLWYDADNVEKMLNNLIFNAIKYTSDHGHIMVRAELTRHPEYVSDSHGVYMELSVIDDGIGIHQKQSGQLFTRFRRLISPFAQKRTAGFGIGLNFVKKLAEIHHGNVAGRSNGLRGMTFVINIPVEEDAYSPDEKAPDIIAEPVLPPSRPADDDKVEEPAKPAAYTLPVTDYTPVRRKLLIVEDQAELVDFLSQVFMADFDVITASNGLEGLETARAEQPDLIISDIMMPIMDGIKMIDRLKNEPETSHIPVIVLTARYREADQVEGFRTGADLYLCKPFSTEVLKSAAQSLLANVERRRREIAGSLGKNDASVDDSCISEFDRRFLKRLNTYIEENLTNSELNINMLCRELCMSRTSFYRKVKELTGLTPYDMLRIFRLNRSAELLRTHKYSLGEVADLTGFSTHSHFSTLFRKHFGMTPTEYLHTQDNQ